MTMRRPATEGWKKRTATHDSYWSYLTFVSKGLGGGPRSLRSPEAQSGASRDAKGGRRNCKMRRAERSVRLQWGCALIPCFVFFWLEDHVGPHHETIRCEMNEMRIKAPECTFYRWDGSAKTVGIGAHIVCVCVCVRFLGLIA